MLRFVVWMFVVWINVWMVYSGDDEGGRECYFRRKWLVGIVVFFMFFLKWWMNDIVFDFFFWYCLCLIFCFFLVVGCLFVFLLILVSFMLCFRFLVVCFLWWLVFFMGNIWVDSLMFMNRVCVCIVVVILNVLLFCWIWVFCLMLLFGIWVGLYWWLVVDVMMVVFFLKVVCWFGIMWVVRFNCCLLIIVKCLFVILRMMVGVWFLLLFLVMIWRIDCCFVSVIC